MYEYKELTEKPLEIIHNRTQHAMDTISIFLAGSTKLVEERNQIKALANDLNATYEKHGVQVLIYTYEYLGEVQDTYNRFIETKADIAIFVLRDQINSYTLEELRIATESKNKNNGKPEIFVFIHSTEGYDSSANNKELTEIIREHLGRQHYLVYNDCNELKTKAKDRLIPIIQSRLQTANQNTTKQVSSKLIRWLIASCVIFCAILTGVILLMLNPKGNPDTTAIGNAETNDISVNDSSPAFSSENPLLLITGGGSAANFVKRNKKVDLDTISNSIRVRLPSGVAWTLVAESVNGKIMDKKSNEKFIPVCLSAGKAEKGDFLTVCSPEEFLEELLMAELKLGEDPMIVYVSRSFFAKNHDLSDLKKTSRLTQKDFVKLLKRGIDSSQVYVTSKKSGTRTAYRNFLPEKDSLLVDSNNIKTFNESSNYSHFKNELIDKGCIILGSENYFVQCLEEMEKDRPQDRFERFSLVDEKGIVVSKPIFLYFPVWIKEKTEKVIIKNCIISFLKAIEPNSKIWKNIKEDKGVYYYKNYNNNDKNIIINLYNDEESSKKK